MREDGSKCEVLGEIKGMVHGFYKNLFSSEMCASMDAVLDAIPSKVTAEMNEDLCKPYMDDEIKARECSIRTPQFEDMALIRDWAATCV